MTDITRTAPLAVRRPDLQRPGIRKLRTGVSLAALFGLLGDAFSMAYVAPYTSHRRRPQVVAEEDLEGRDSDW